VSLAALVVGSIAATMWAMGSGNNSANIRRAELARWVAFQRERAYFEAADAEELRRARELWRRGGGQERDPAETRAALAELAELFPDNVQYSGTLPELQVLVNRGLPRGRPYIHAPAAWPKVRARAVAKIRRRRAGDNYPSRARIARELGIGERTVYNYDRANRPPRG
jgi:hypothetical protein